MKRITSLILKLIAVKGGLLTQTTVLGLHRVHLVRSSTLSMAQEGAPRNKSKTSRLMNRIGTIHLKLAAQISSPSGSVSAATHLVWEDAAHLEKLFTCQIGQITSVRNEASQHWQFMKRHMLRQVRSCAAMSSLDGKATIASRSLRNDM